jgi:hypothetical protein
MNRSLAYVGVGVILAGIALVASPIVLTGRMTLGVAPIAGFIIAPLGLFVIGFAAASFDPRRTTVRTFGQDEPPPRPEPPEELVVAQFRPVNPKAPVRCPNCRTVMTYDLSRCPRCAEDRPCRACARPLASVDDQAVCPGCTRQELFCNCSPSGIAMRKIGVGRTAMTR